MNCIDSEFNNNHMITDFQINYIHESKEGQELTIYKKEEENQIEFLIKRDEEEIVKAKIKYKNMKWDRF